MLSWRRRCTSMSSPTVCENSVSSSCILEPEGLVACGAGKRQDSGQPGRPLSLSPPSLHSPSSHGGFPWPEDLDRGRCVLNPARPYSRSPKGTELTQGRVSRLHCHVHRQLGVPGTAGCAHPRRCCLAPSSSTWGGSRTCLRTCDWPQCLSPLRLEDPTPWASPIMPSRLPGAPRPRFPHLCRGALGTRWESGSVGSAAQRAASCNWRTGKEEMAW